MAGVKREGGPALGALSAWSRRAPLTALSSPLLVDENLQHESFAKVLLRTFAAIACGSRSGSARAVSQRRSDNAPRASHPGPKIVRRPRE